MTLRFGSLRVPTTVHWPREHSVSLALVLSDELSPTHPWLEHHVVVAVGSRHAGSVELAALHWTAEHVRELGADPRRLLVAGGARAAWLALAARDSGWPALWRQILVHPSFSAQRPMPAQVLHAPPAIVVRNAARDDGARYAARLRAAGVDVQEVRDERHG